MMAGNSLAINPYFIERENMKIKTNVKAGQNAPPIVRD
jgi:hypothetical protein